jgi:hypothetical protein
MTILTAQEAQQIRLNKRSVSHDTYKLLFEIVIQNVKLKSEMNQTRLRYKIPAYVLGRPAINCHHASRYISEKLKFYGYKSHFFEHNGAHFVDVDWSLEKAKPHKKKRDVKREKQIDTNIRSNPAEAVRRLEMIKLQLQNTMKKK